MQTSIGPAKAHHARRDIERRAGIGAIPSFPATRTYAVPYASTKMKIALVCSGSKSTNGNHRIGLDPDLVQEVVREVVAVAGGRYADSSGVAWSDLAALPLCLFAPSLQQRRIIDDALRRSGVEVRPAIETDSILALTTHVRTGRWVSVISSLVRDAIDLSGPLRAIPIVEPELVSSIGLVVSKRFPLQPAMAVLLAEAKRGFTYEPEPEIEVGAKAGN